MIKLSTFRNSLIIIGITVVLILGTQVYRTVNNYQANKERFIKDVQSSLDLSVEKYYADKARSQMAIMGSRSRLFSPNEYPDSVMNRIGTISVTIDSLVADQEIEMFQDSVLHSNEHGFQYSWSSDSESGEVKKEMKRFQTDTNSGYSVMVTTTDSIEDFNFNYVDFSRLTQKIIISTSEKMMNIEVLNEILDDEFARRDLSIDYVVSYRRGSDKNNIELTTSESGEELPLLASAKSTYLLPGESLDIQFENATLEILKKGGWDLVVSFAIVFSVIGALLYLYRIIRNQKELAMIKDDLIGNVTHEFKTPIATVSTALEGIANFNEVHDPEKTRRYIDMSRAQLAKLNVMVEKLMETATIDSGDIEINPVETNITELSQKVIESFQMRVEDKKLTSDLPETKILAMVDPFHIENVLGNLIDNAIKYGGDEISVSLKQKGKQLEFQVVDNGGAIEKVDQQRIFEKLYRIPKGNIHNVKGFGIGLYYSNEMVEKHGGQLRLDVSPNRTCFTVTI